RAATTAWISRSTSARSASINGRVSTNVSDPAHNDGFRHLSHEGHMSRDIGDAFSRDVLGSAGGDDTSSLPEDFKRETLGVVHPGHLAVMELDPGYFAALKNYYSTWTISRPDAAIPRHVTEFIITGILLTHGALNGG